MGFLFQFPNKELFSSVMSVYGTSRKIHWKDWVLIWFIELLVKSPALATFRSVGVWFGLIYMLFYVTDDDISLI